jgi:transcriptional regulator with XRE-family HTH domain
MRTKLKIFRIAHKLNQHQLAAKLGYERAYYGHIERGYQDGSAAFWERLQKAFGLTDDELQELKTID